MNASGMNRPAHEGSAADGERPIRVVRIIARLNVGGPTLHVTLLTERLREPAFASTLVCGPVGADEGDMTYFAHEHGVQPIVIEQLGRALHPLRDLVTVWRMYRLIRRMRPDIVHTHTAKAGFVGRLAARMAGVPVIVHTFHGHVFSGYFSPQKAEVFRLLEALCARLSTGLITLSDGLSRELSETYRIAPAAKIHVLPLGLDLDRFLAAERGTGGFRAAWAVPSDAPLVGIVGRLVPVKNHRLFLAAAAGVAARVPGVRFAIVGDGELRAALEAEVERLGLGGAVVFTGWQRDLADVYAALDVNVISSDNEGTPVSLIEALAAGCPVVSARVGGVGDLLEDGRWGTLVAPGDADALADAIVRALTAPPTPEMTTAARAHVRARYSIEVLAAALAAQYRLWLSERGR